MSAKHKLTDMQEIAASRGGRCLSDEYVNAHFKLSWECKHGHVWSARFNSVQGGRWCPECSTGLGERICRSYFEQLFIRKFPPTWPEWLRNQNGNLMQLDGFCLSLGLAFEHQGIQHYLPRKGFVADVHKIQSHDEIKRKLCKQMGIILIQVPSIPALLPLGEVKSYIKKCCIDNKILLPGWFDEKVVDLSVAYSTSRSEECFHDLIAIANGRGGICLSDGYINATSKMLWRCAKEHEWMATSDNIKRGRWCPICGQKEAWRKRKQLHSDCGNAVKSQMSDGPIQPSPPTP